MPRQVTRGMSGLRTLRRSRKVEWSITAIWPPLLLRMEPITVRYVQVLPWLGISVLVAVLFGRSGATAVVVVTAVAAAVWGALALAYGRRRHRLVSVDRSRGDLRMAVNGALAFPAPLAVALALLIAGLEPLVEPGWCGWLLATPLALVLVSSAIDWYVILPFRDGVVGDPVCIGEDEDRRRRYTRAWVIHRALCEIGLAATVTLGAVEIALHYFPDGSETLQNVVAFLGGIVIVLPLLKRWHACLQFCLDQGPVLGAWVKGDTKKGKSVAGFFRDVSVGNGIKVVRRPDGLEEFIPLRNAVPDITTARPVQAPVCTPDGCCRWLKTGTRMTCERGLATSSPSPPAPG